MNEVIQKFIQHIGVMVVIIGLTGIAYWLILSDFEAKVRHVEPAASEIENEARKFVIEELKIADKGVEDKAIKFVRRLLVYREPEALRFSSTIKSPEKERLQTQLLEAQRREKMHRDIMVSFYGQYYTAVTIFSITGVLAGILLVVISKAGWGGTNQYLITAFLTLAGISLYFGTLPLVFREDQNITDNKALHFQYATLENELRSYAITGEDLTGAKKTPSDFIHYVDRQLQKFYSLPVGFDYTKVPGYRVYKEQLDVKP